MRLSFSASSARSTYTCKANCVAEQSGKVVHNQGGRVIRAIGGEAYRAQGHTNEIRHQVQRYKHWVYGGCFNEVG